MARVPAKQTTRKALLACLAARERDLRRDLDPHEADSLHSVMRRIWTLANEASRLCDQRLGHQRLGQSVELLNWIAWDLERMTCSGAQPRKAVLERQQEALLVRLDLTRKEAVYFFVDEALRENAVLPSMAEAVRRVKSTLARAFRAVQLRDKDTAIATALAAYAPAGLDDPAASGCVAPRGRPKKSAVWRTESQRMPALKALLVALGIDVPDDVDLLRQLRRERRARLVQK